MSADRSATREAYRRTTYRASLEGTPVAIRIGERCEPLDLLLRVRGADSWAFVTAWNPMARVLPAEENARRHRELLKTVEASGHAFFPGEGVGESPDWPPEQSLLILGIPERDAVELGDRFGQEAIVVGARGMPARLVFCERDRFRGALLGLACGDALGTTLEFKSRGTFKPLVDMVGGGPFMLRPGQWTDDTSMALCLARSLLETGGFDPRDQMQRFVRWWREGYLSSTGKCFDIGVATESALKRFASSAEPFSGSKDPAVAGNGSLMRLAPVPMFFAPDAARAIRFSAESSRTTHASAECLDACRLFGAMLVRALAGAARDEVLTAGAFFADSTGPLAPKIAAIASGAYRSKPEREISGSGYVVNALEAALWCFATTDSYRDAVLRAANLGDDADTTAAICGQIAGAFYGESGIPDAWRAKLAMRSLIEETADALREARPA